MVEKLLEAKNIKKSFFKGQQEVEVLSGVNLSIEHGKTIAIIGPSGTGKTTLLQILGMLDQPSSGNVKVRGEIVSKLSDKKISRLRNQFFGFIFQFHHLINEFNALENTMMPLLVRRDSIKLAREKAKQLLAEIGLSDRFYHKPSELSGGECQRVAVARALIAKPLVVLADEPTGNLDPDTAEKVLNGLINLNHSVGSSLIVVTHNHDLANKLDQVVILERGTIAEYDNKRE